MFSIIFTGSFGQNVEKKWIFLTDKGNNVEYYLSHPELYLSQRAIERRAKYGIPIDITDVPVKRDYLQTIQSTGAKIVGVSNWLNAVCVEANSTQIQNLSILPFVKEIKNHTTYRRRIEEIHENMPLNNTAKINSYYGSAFVQNDMIGIPCIHNAGYTGKNVIITLMDSGYRNADTLSCFKHVFLQGRLLNTYDFVDNQPTAWDEDGHGTLVWSTIAAKLPNVIVGTAPDAKFILYRTEQVSAEINQEEVNWLLASQRADSLGTDIIHSSLGYSIFDPGQNSYAYADMDGKTTIITQAAVMARRKGIMITNSAGNEGTSSWGYITAPSDADSILCVGAVDANRIRAAFSSYGPTYDGRIKPDVMAMGVAAACVSGNSGNVVSASGTSLSGPLIAGLSACLLQAKPTLSPIQLVNAIRDASDRKNTPDNFYGYGVPDGCAALASITYLDQHDSNTPSFEIYPNPVTNTLQVECSGISGKIKLSIFNALSQVIKQETFFVTGDNARITIPVHTLLPGNYYLKIDTQNGTLGKILIKQ
ncbi:MAG: S8 family peptidase [Bacteroidia bacterium]|nr:S8 family peptidase [Bacteroidia bacterium]MDW8346379.1 S8 family peptidase [Bacteroidia bacterium]